MKIEILVVTAEKKTSAAGKPYELINVAYKNLSFQGKVESKPVMPFGVTANTAKLLKGAQQGEVYEITVVKNDKGFNDWVDAAATSAGAPSPAPTTARAASPVVSAPSAPAAKSTFETPEERAKKQVYIVRQSSITAALTFLNNTIVGTAKELVTTDDVVAVAKEFENYVFGIEVSPSPKAYDLEDMDDLPE